MYPVLAIEVGDASRLLVGGEPGAGLSPTFVEQVCCVVASDMALSRWAYAWDFGVVS